MPTCHDVVIVGARAAGASTAMLLARLGHDVVVVDRALPGTDTISTHQISRAGVVALHRWGLLDAVLASGAPAIRQVTFHAAGEAVTRAVKDKSGVDLLVAPRRYLLDDLLASSAAAAGAAVRTGVTVSAVHLDDSGRATGVAGVDANGSPVDIRARYVVGADGLSSLVARAVGAEVIEDRGAAGATQYAYFAGLAWPGIEFYVEPGSFAGVFPTHHGEACIWVCTSSAEARAARRTMGGAAFAALLRRAAPTLAERLRTARQTSPVRGMLRAPNIIRRAHGPGWALVGDAGYHRDPTSGHGLSDAFRDAEFLAAALDQALHGSDLTDYQLRHDLALREIFEVTCAMVAYPSVPEFVDLTRRLGAAIDAEAAELAALPVPGALAPALAE